MLISFTVLGEPQGKGRPRFSRTANGKAITHTPEKTVLYENLIVTEYRAQTKSTRFADDAMLRISVNAYYGIPSGVSKKKRADMMSGIIRPTKKPDTDNVLKVVCDSLNKVAYRDDAQIVAARISKYYSDMPRIEVSIQNI